MMIYREVTIKGYEVMDGVAQKFGAGSAPMSVEQAK